MGREEANVNMIGGFGDWFVGGLAYKHVRIKKCYECTEEKEGS